jgi:hypothetical protein
MLRIETTLENKVFFAALRRFALLFAPELAKIIAAWPTMPEPLKAAILAIVASAVGQSSS